jgi:23S rRNA (cytosine1962-C5)-methyltransferase
VAIRVEPAAERALRKGHPWLFADSIREMSRAATPGTVGVVFDRKGRFLAAGLLDPESPIRLRVLAAGTPARIGPPLFRSRIQEALALRTPLLQDPLTTGYRVLHGENDGMPGLVVDRYGEALVMKCYTLAWAPHLQDVTAALVQDLGPSSVLLLAARRVAASGHAPPALKRPTLLHGVPLGGGAPPHESGAPLPGGGALPYDEGAPSPERGALPFLEAGLRYEAHPLQGQKTGFYLDQRENRARVERHAAARRREGTSPLRVLNVFSYTGGFSLAAARGGADEVVSMDASGAALQQAERHFRLNGADPGVARARHRTREGDAFLFLEELAGTGKRFGMVILDPPSFAKETGQVRKALEAYRRLTRLALGVLAPGGTLVQASCSSRVPAADFHGAVLAAAAGTGRPLVELERTEHPLDHPVTFPEGAYLKCLFARG